MTQTSPVDDTTLTDTFHDAFTASGVTAAAITPSAFEAPSHPQPKPKHHFHVSVDYNDTEWTRDTEAINRSEAITQLSYVIATQLSLHQQTVRREIVNKVSVQDLGEVSVTNRAKQFILCPESINRVGLSIVPFVVRQYYFSNKSLYQRLQFDEADIEGYLYEKVMLGTYARIAAKNQFVYPTEDQFRKSFYTACRRACMAHYRMHIKSQSRGTILRSHVIELDNPDLAAPTLVASPISDYLKTVHTIIDACKCKLQQRMLFLLAYEICDTKLDVRNRHPQVHTDDFEHAWGKLVVFMGSWRDELQSRDSDLDPRTTTQATQSMLPNQ